MSDLEKFRLAAMKQRDRQKRDRKLEQDKKEGGPWDLEREWVWYHCWDCDERDGEGEFLLPSVPGRRVVFCPRYSTHRNVEYMGKADTRIKWQKKKRG